MLIAVTYFLFEVSGKVNDFIQNYFKTLTYTLIMSAYASPDWGHLNMVHWWTYTVPLFLGSFIIRQGLLTLKRKTIKLTAPYILWTERNLIASQGLSGVVEHSYTQYFVIVIWPSLQVQIMFVFLLMQCFCYCMLPVYKPNYSLCTIYIETVKVKPFANLMSLYWKHHMFKLIKCKRLIKNKKVISSKKSVQKQPKPGKVSSTYKEQLEEFC